MDFELLHNGKNIKDLIKISRCYSCDKYGGILDDLTVVFESNGNRIDFYENDELEVKTVGGFTSGIMYLDSCASNIGRFTIKAVSCRHNNKKKKSKIWHRVKLSKLIDDVARDTGLTPLKFGVQDFTYESISQINETDLQFLARICKREGYSIKCDNKNLIIFNEYYLESNGIPIAISKGDVDNNYYFTREAGLSSMTAMYFDPQTKKRILYTATDENVSGRDETVIEYMQDMNEASRFSKSYLREANRFCLTGIFEIPYNGGISAGTVSDLTGFAEFDGRYVVYEARHDFVLEKTGIKVRKLLNY